MLPLPGSLYRNHQSTATLGLVGSGSGTLQEMPATPVIEASSMASATHSHRAVLVAMLAVGGAIMDGCNPPPGAPTSRHTCNAEWPCAPWKRYEFDARQNTNFGGKQASPLLLACLVSVACHTGRVRDCVATAHADEHTLHAGSSLDLHELAPMMG